MRRNYSANLSWAANSRLREIVSFGVTGTTDRHEYDGCDSAHMTTDPRWISWLSQLCSLVVKNLRALFLPIRDFKISRSQKTFWKRVEITSQFSSRLPQYNWLTFLLSLHKFTGNNTSQDQTGTTKFTACSSKLWQQKRNNIVNCKIFFYLQPILQNDLCVNRNISD